MIDRLTSMAVFAKAADLGSFTAAAAALDMSPQMVGKHVSLLEERLGTELIRRTTRRQSLTDIGRAFHERCRLILAETEAAERLGTDGGRVPRGRLRVNAPVTFGALRIAPLVGTFLDDHPEVAVELTLSDRYVDPTEEGYDVVVRLGNLADSTLVARALAPHRLMACASPAYLARKGRPATPNDLAEHDCLGFVFTTGLPLAEWTFSRAGAARTVRIATRFQSNDSRVLLDAALAGRGIALLSESVLLDHVAAGRLEPLLSDFEAPIRPMHVLVSAGRRRTAALRLFVDRLVEALK